MKLFISNIKNSKFMDNIIFNNIPELEILYGNHRDQLYKIHQQRQINSYIFDIEVLDKELLQFVMENYLKTKIFLYHNYTHSNRDIIEKIPCYHLVHDQHALSNAITIPELVNTNIFYNKKIQNRDQNSIICFIKDIHDISDKFEALLYPKTKLPIKIYGSKGSHCQNLGSVTEQDKADILNKNIKYLDIDGSYLNEALICGCDIYTINTLLDNNSINHDIKPKYESYESFLVNILT